MLRKTRISIRPATDAGTGVRSDSQGIDTQEVPMSITKDFRYEVGVAWEGDRITSVTSPDKPELTVATPPEFKNGVPASGPPRTCWSPLSHRATP